MSSAVYSFITFQSPASWESLLILGLPFCFPPLLLTSETSYEKLDHPAPTSTRWPTLLLGSWSLLKDTGANSRQLCSDPASPSQSFNLIHSCYWLVQSRIPSIPPDSTRNLLWNQNHRHFFLSTPFFPRAKPNSNEITSVTRSIGNAEEDKQDSRAMPTASLTWTPSSNMPQRQAWWTLTPALPHISQDRPHNLERRTTTCRSWYPAEQATGSSP